ncbi:MAG: SAM-dependent methyltransferase [Acidobacteria bacterium]|nr:MAG: SAM-dependent methyltransferase [Acidobacteriota bacterium]
MVDIVEHLKKRIRSEGPLSFRDYMEEVLRFYYSSARNRIGAAGDFYTAADLDPIFGQLLAKQFEQWAAPFGRFTIVELGAGKGLLAHDILRHRHFPYMILERSPAMRRRQQELLKDHDVTWIDELPRGITGCIFSNEFFDALPVHRLVRRGDVLKEIYVTEDFHEIERDLQPPVPALYDRLGGDTPPLHEGQTVEVNLEARHWIRRIAESLHRGYHVAIDYGYLRDEFYAQPHGSLMCYWRHQAVENPYIRIGEQDITAHVNFSDLMEEPSLQTMLFTTQKDYLIQLGILDEMEKLATAGDSVSMQRLLRMKNLILPGSMGERFKVLVQSKQL